MSTYEAGYIRWFWKRNLRHLLVLCVVLAMIPLACYLTTISFNTEEYQHFSFVLSLFAYAFASMILAFGMPIYLFRYLMQKRSTDLYYAMPITKGRFFLLQFLLGALCVLVLPAIAYGIALSINTPYYDSLPYTLFMILPCGGLSFALYCIVTYFTLKCNNLWDACVVNLGYLVAPLMLYVGVSSIAQSAVNLQLIGDYGSSQEILASDVLLNIVSLPATLVYFCSGMCQAVYDNGTLGESVWNVFIHAEGIHVSYILYWMVLGTVLACLAYRVYKKRPQEDSEQRTTAKQCYPALIVVVTIALLFASDISYGFQNLSLINLAIVLILFWTMVCFAKRKVQFTKGMAVSFLGMCALANGLTFVFVSSNGFGRIHELPDISEVTSVDVRLYSADDKISVPPNYKLYEEFKGVLIGSISMDNIKDSEVIQDVYEVQNAIVEQIEDENFFNVRYEYEIIIIYMEEDGSRITRSYSFTESYYDELKPLIEEWMNKGYFDGSLMNAKSQYEQSLESAG